MKLHLVLLSLCIYISAVEAGESILVGKAPNGLVFEFSDTSLPLTEQEIETGKTHEHRFDLYILKEMFGVAIDPKTKKSKRIKYVEPKAIASEIPAPCVWRYEEEQLICSPNAPHGLANVRYQYNRTLGIDGGFRCIQGCSKQVPRLLKFEGVESGC